MAWESSGHLIPPPEPSQTTAKSPSTSAPPPTLPLPSTPLPSTPLVSTPLVLGDGISERAKLGPVAAKAKALQRELTKRRKAWNKTRKNDPAAKDDRYLLGQIREALGGVESAALVASTAGLRALLAQAKELKSFADSVVFHPPPSQHHPLPLQEEEEEVEVEAEPEPHPLPIRLTSLTNQPITVQAVISDPHHHSVVYGASSSAAYL